MEERLRRLFFDRTVGDALLVVLAVYAVPPVVFQSSGLLGSGWEPIYHTPARVVVFPAVEMVQSLGCRGLGCPIASAVLTGVFTYLFAVTVAACYRTIETACG